MIDYLAWVVKLVIFENGIPFYQLIDIINSKSNEYALF